MDVRLAAGLAVGAGKFAMQMQDVAAAGAFVQIVDVLGDESELRDAVRHGGNRVMGGVRL